MHLSPCPKVIKVSVVHAHYENCGWDESLVEPSYSLEFLDVGYSFKHVAKRVLRHLAMVVITFESTILDSRGYHKERMGEYLPNQESQWPDHEPFLKAVSSLRILYLLSSIFFIKHFNSLLLLLFKKLQVISYFRSVFFPDFFHLLIILIVKDILEMTLSGLGGIFHEHHLTRVVLFDQLSPSIFEFLDWLVDLDYYLRGSFYLLRELKALQEDGKANVIREEAFEKRF